MSHSGQATGRHFHHYASRLFHLKNSRYIFFAVILENFCDLSAFSVLIITTLYRNGSQFILKPVPRPNGKIIFAPFALFDVMFLY